MSSRPSARATRAPSAMSLRATASGTTCPNGPSWASATPSTGSAPITRNPSRSNSATTADNNRSSPSARYPRRANNLAARQSGRRVARDGRRTPPASTNSLTPFSRSKVRPRAAAPMRHQACGTPATVSGSAAPSNASTNTSRPDCRQASTSRRGRAPPPATMPRRGAAVALSAISRLRLQQPAAGIGADEFDHILDRAHPGKAAGGGVDAIAEGAFRVKQHLIGGAQFLDLVTAETAALHADDVEPAEPGANPDHLAVRNDIALGAGHAADHRVLADPDELMDGAQTAENGVIAEHDMAGQRRVVGHDDMIADPAVMGDMGADHKQAIAADPGDHAAAIGARVHRHIFADRVAAPDNQRRILAAIFEVLRRVAERGKRENPRSGADRGPPVDDHMAHQHDARAEFDPLANNAIGPDHDIVGKLRA